VASDGSEGYISATVRPDLLPQIISSTEALESHSTLRA
jgi:hypothetical protein